MRQRAGTDKLTKGHEQPVNVDPAIFGHHLFQQLACFFGLFGLHISPSIYDAVNMHIDTDTRFAGSNAKG